MSLRKRELSRLADGRSAGLLEYRFEGTRGKSARPIEGKVLAVDESDAISRLAARGIEVSAENLTSIGLASARRKRHRLPAGFRPRSSALNFTFSDWVHVAFMFAFLCTVMWFIGKSDRAEANAIAAPIMLIGYWFTLRYRLTHGVWPENRGGGGD